MGMDYHLKCMECANVSESYEYSIVGYIECKFPDECEEQVVNWTRFITEHNGHRLALVDSREKMTNPAKITGKYVLFGDES